MALGRPGTIEWSSHDGQSLYTAAGSRDVLYISSDTLHSSVSSSVANKAVPRRDTAYGVTNKEASMLESQGISRESQDCDLNIMVARHKLDERHRVVSIMKNTTCSAVKSAISNLLSTTDKEGVVVCYIGHGKLEAGDWCFKDDFLTFQDLYKLYTSNTQFRGRVLSIISDCSYSGQWVRECMETMDSQGIGPCGHKAKNKSILIKVLASCQPFEIPQKFSLSVLGARNDKNSGVLSFSTYYKSPEIRPKQHSSGIDCTLITCKASIDRPCCLAEGYTWRKWQEAKRIQLLTTIESGNPMWYYLLLTENEDKVKELTDLMSKGHFSVKLCEYGRVLLKGSGVKPSNQARDLLYQKYAPVYA